ncbi:MAG: nucleotidyltransferase family protein [Gaiellaceae bacterium]
MDVVVMAAGEGRRLRPLTEVSPKPVLPIGGRPVIATLVRELASAGFEEVTVVTGHLAEQIERLLGDGAGFGLRIRYARQPEPLGSADAVRCALEAGARPPLLVLAADTVFASGDLSGVAELSESTTAALGVRPSADTGKTPVTVLNGLVTAIGEGEGEVRAAPLWILGEEIVAMLPELSGPPFELADAVREAISSGKEVLAVELGPTRDLTRPEDVITHNFPYLSKGGK